jgi:transcriptional regulator with XRE-family HTH domain
MNKNNLSNNLYLLRRKAGLSQEEFAEKLCVSRQAVSKWERGEAYPDTENLIVISDMFSVTIDELLKSEAIAEDCGDMSENTDEESGDFLHVNIGDKVKVNLNGGITVNSDDENVNIDLGNCGITVNDEDGNVKVNLGKGGITVNDENGNVKVKLSKGHIFINDDDEDDDDDDGEGNSTVVITKDKKRGVLSVMYTIPYRVVTALAFLCCGFFFNGWGWAWTFFMTIPIYYSLLGAIRKRSFSNFAYAVFVPFIYCLLGTLIHWWHPGWLIFLTIPIYYPIAEALDRHIRR